MSSPIPPAKLKETVKIGQMGGSIRNNIFDIERKLITFALDNRNGIGHKAGFNCSNFVKKGCDTHGLFNGKRRC